MSDGIVPVGQRFSFTYLDRGKPTSDSRRARVRAYRLFDRAVHVDVWRDCISNINYEIGHDFSDIEEFFLESDLRDFLDSITVTWRFLTIRKLYTPAVMWISECARIFKEENLGYRIDDRGGVHYLVDAEFERSKANIISGLGAARYGAVLHAFEAAHNAFDGHSPDGKLAMRHAFEAVEILFRLICNKAPRLGAAEINTHLKPLVEQLHVNDVTAMRATQKMIASLCDWVDGVHFYRHGQGVEEPTQPPLSLAVYTVSTSASCLRWLIDIDQSMKNSEATPE